MLPTWVGIGHSLMSTNSNLRDPQSFPEEVIGKLEAYVYRLIDPRNGHTFYVGKGRGNRVFSHVRGEPNLETGTLDNKMGLIREIRHAGFEVAHVIHRHGMDDSTAKEVEAALIDAYPGLTNKIPGVASDHAASHATEIIRHYLAEKADFKHKALLININKTYSPQGNTYEAVRFAWSISRSEAKKAEVVLATARGIIRGAYVDCRWLDATKKNFPKRKDAPIPGRFGFVGREAPDDIKDLYINKRVPECYRNAGYPIRYTWHPPTPSPDLMEKGEKP